MKMLARFMTLALALLLIRFAVGAGSEASHWGPEAGSVRLIVRPKTFFLQGELLAERTIESVLPDSKRLLPREPGELGAMPLEGLSHYDSGVLEGRSYTRGNLRVTRYDLGGEWWLSYRFLVVWDVRDPDRPVVLAAGYMVISDDLSGGWRPITQLEMCPSSFEGAPGTEFHFDRGPDSGDWSFFGLHGSDTTDLEKDEVEFMEAVMKPERDLGR